jgi:hypothetical protein
MFKVISIDEKKESIKGYSPKDANKFHIESAKTANKKFDQELKKIKNKNVILMCGGSASGKTEFIEKFCPIFDEKKNENLEENELSFARVDFEDSTKDNARKELINFLQQNQFSEEEILQLVIENK